MFICIDCVVYNQYIIHDGSLNIAECLRYCVVGDSAGGPKFYHNQINDVQVLSLTQQLGCRLITLIEC